MVETVPLVALGRRRRLSARAAEQLQAEGEDPGFQKSGDAPTTHTQLGRARPGPCLLDPAGTSPLRPAAARSDAPRQIRGGAHGLR